MSSTASFVACGILIPMITIGMSTTCAGPRPAADAFAIAAEVGFDGIEVMVTADPVTRDAAALAALSAEHGIPVLSVHAPVLPLAQLVWGDATTKLEKSAEMAATLGAPTVVVHPPFRWQGRYARDFEATVRTLEQRYGVQLAVENMFPWLIGGVAIRGYAPSPDPIRVDCDAITLDFSHASLGGRDSLEYAMAMGSRLRHIHLCDGAGSMAEGRILDEHLIPGHGVEPVAEVLQYLGSRSWDGSVIAEVNTRSARTEEERLAMLRETREFAAGHLAAGRAYRRSKHRTA